MNTNPRLTPVLDENGKIKRFYIRGFFCQCACNVFLKPDNTRLNLYECNACGTWYEK